MDGTTKVFTSHQATETLVFWLMIGLGDLKRSFPALMILQFYSMEI